MRTKDTENGNSGGAIRSGAVRDNRKLNIFGKSVRFAKRLSAYLRLSFGRKRKRPASKTVLSSSDKKADKKSRLFLTDRFYSEDRIGSEAKADGSVRGLISGVRFGNGRKYGHCAAPKPAEKRGKTA